MQWQLPFVLNEILDILNIRVSCPYNQVLLYRHSNDQALSKRDHVSSVLLIIRPPFSHGHLTIPPLPCR